ncbi:MAG: glutathione S-transferase [Roseovarius sp.]|nr:glutathione S-transferase [Roseovarius sp.]
MSYILYFCPDCASQAVRMVLEWSGAKYRNDTVDMDAGAHRNAEFLHLNPRGMVPVLSDGTTGAMLSETGAILSLLAEQRGRLAPATSNPKARALFLQRSRFLLNTLHADAQVQYCNERYVGDDLAKAARPKIHDWMRSHFSMLDAAIAEHGRPWLPGGELSVCATFILVDAPAGP